MEIKCIVTVTGEASSPEDDNVPGVYEIEVHSEDVLDLDNLDDITKSEIATRVKDEFHDHIGIDNLDDFVIELKLENGVILEEEDEASVEYSNKITASF